MSRSFRKHAYEWVSKSWYRSHEKMLRGRVRVACLKAARFFSRPPEETEMDFDPDRDWEEAYRTNKEGADWGTKCGFDVEPDPDKEATWHGYYVDLLRKK